METTAQNEELHNLYSAPNIITVKEEVMDEDGELQCVLLCRLKGIINICGKKKQYMLLLVSDARLWSATKGFGGGLRICGDF